MSGWSVNLTTLFLGRLRPKQLTSTLCTYFGRNWQVPLGERKVCGLIWYLTWGLWLFELDMLPTQLHGPALCTSMLKFLIQRAAFC